MTPESASQAKIRVMSPDLANQIAAGEVVERPASIVKELVENSLDAGATRIQVSATAGGRTSLRVQDNGSGMSPEDAVLAFERFATSKLYTSADLEQLTTLGFRGEALPSIASVAKVELLTRPKDAPEGTRVVVNFGEVVEYSAVGCPEGTDISVKELFRNVPARLKYLRAPGTEARHITERVQLYVLAWPEVEWRLVQDGKVRLVHNTGTAEGALLAVLGQDAARNMLPFESDFGNLKLRGFLSQPAYGRASRAYQFCFVNRRPVTSKLLSYAIFDAYQGLIEPGKHPVVVLHLEMAPHLVDCNVHPQKLEVRFAHSLQVLERTRAALRAALDKARGAAGLRPHKVASTPGPVTLHRPSAASGNTTPPRQGQLQMELGYASGEVVRSTPLSRELEARRGQVSDELGLVPLGCFHNTYILAQRGDDLLLIDQHAAHERIIYDRLRKQLDESAGEGQELLTPVTLELQPAQLQALEAHRAVLEKMGFKLQEFGSGALLVSAVPAFLASADLEQVLGEFADEVMDSGEAPDLEAKVHRTLAVMACKAAVKAGEALTLPEIVALLKDLLQTTAPYTCPHGRPTTIALSLEQVERLFKRK